MFKLVVFSVLVAVAIAKPSAYYYSSPLAYSAPVVAAPSSVSSHSRTDYHNENSHNVVGGGVAAVADPVVASVGAVPDPSAVQQYPTEVDSGPIVALSLPSFSNYSRTDSSNEYSETAVQSAVPSTSSLVLEQLPVVEIKSENNIPEIVVSSSPSPVSLNYLPPAPQNFVVSNVHISNEDNSNAVEVMPEIGTDKSVIVSSADTSSTVDPLRIVESLSSLPEGTETDSESNAVNKRLNEVSILLQQSLVTAEPVVTEAVDSEVQGISTTINSAVIESSDGQTTSTFFNTSVPIEPINNIQKDLSTDSLVNSFVPNQPINPLQIVQSEIEGRRGDSPFLVQNSKTVTPNYDSPQNVPSAYISYISNYEPQSNAAVKYAPASLINDYTEVEKQTVLSPHITLDLVSRTSSVPSANSYDITVETVSSQNVPNSATPAVLQYTNVVSSSPLPNIEDNESKNIISKIDADIDNLKGNLQQTFPNLVSVEESNSVVNIVPAHTPTLTVAPTPSPLTAYSKTDYGREVSQHWIGISASPTQSVLDSNLIQPLISLKTFSRVNRTDETHQSVTPLVGNVDPTLLSYDSVPISIPVSSSSYNATNYSNETSFSLTPLGTVASYVADSSFGPASVAYSSPVEVAPGSSVSSSSRTDYHHEASRTDVDAGGVAVSQPVVAAYSAAPVAYSSAPVAVAGSPASSVSSHTKTDYHHENSQHAVGPGASVAAVRASPVVYSASPVAYSAAPVAVAASPASSVSSHTKTDYHHEDSRHQQAGSGVAVAALRASPVAYSSPAVSYSVPSLAYSAPAVSYSSPVVVRKVAVAAPSYLNEVSYTPSVYARRVYSAPAVAYSSSPVVSYSSNPVVSYSSSPVVSYSSPVAYAAGPASSSSSSIRTGGYHHEDHQQNVY